MPGKTLGVRRLQCGRKDLFPLNKTILNLYGLIHNKKKIFIDKFGKPFIYEKTLNSILKCYRIKRIDKKETASVIWLNGINHPYTIPRPPINNPGWARILHLEQAPWMLYDYVSHPTKDTYRRV